jgi:hypothetical protein
MMIKQNGFQFPLCFPDAIVASVGLFFLVVASVGQMRGIFWVIWNQAITIFRSWRNAITIRVF